MIGFAIVLFLCAGLVIDGGLAINKRMRIADDAEQAARIGADSIDVAEFRRTETLVIDKQLASQRIAGYMSDLGYGGGNWTADVQQGRVSVVRDRQQQDLHPRPVRRRVPGARLGRGRARHRPEPDARVPLPRRSCR